LLKFSPLFFSSFTGSEFTFSRYETDLRFYKEFYHSDVFAFQLYNVFSGGTPPFRMQALLGSDSHMRGYLQGRFRDKNYSTAQAECRLKIWKFIGVALFSGAGNVYAHTNEITDNLKTFYGAGLRLKVDKENDINMRFDYSIGDNSNGFYIAFGEAF
jgi:hypothetical protein